jgi:hypothetical protein
MALRNRYYTAVVAVAATILGAEACPFLGYNPGSDVENPHKAESESETRESGCDDAKTRSGRTLQDLFEGTPEDAIVDAKEWIGDIIDDDNDLGPKFVRLGFHDCVGGCNGCVNLSRRDNFGLDVPIEWLGYLVDYYSNQLTRADIWALAALHAAYLAQRNGDAVDYPFDYYGRPTCDDEDGTGGPVDDMPSSHFTTDEVLAYFLAEFDFDPQETVAIMGAHTLGKLSVENSGFDAPQGWVPNEHRLDNDFFDFLLTRRKKTGNSIFSKLRLSSASPEGRAGPTTAAR